MKALNNSYWPTLVLAAVSLVSAQAGDIWEEVDVVPMPREITLSGDAVTMSPENFVLVTGPTPQRQSQLGAEWINKRITQLGGAPLQILKTGETVPANTRPIVIGTREDNPQIADAAEKAQIKVGEKDPGVRGYVIDFSKDGPVFVAGADTIGTLYGCVTLGEFLQANAGAAPTLKAANVRDWPDIQYLYVLDMEPPSDVLKEPDSPTARASYLSKMARMYDTMLRRKLSIVWYKPLMWGDTAFRDMTPYARETMRLGIEAGKELGIEALYYHLSPFVGLRSDHPDINPDLLEQKPKARYDKWLQSWSMDEERRVYAKELGQWIKDVGFTDVGFHDTDTGGYLNPANWNNRGPFDQKRWGDDYTAATINKFKIFHDELVKANPDLRLNFTLYPYNSEIFDPSEKAKADLQRTLNLNATQLADYKKRYEHFWTQLNSAFPKNVSFAIREPWSADGGPGLKAFLKLIDGRPLFAWYGLAAAEFYSNVPAWLGTLHSSSVDDIVFTQNIYVDRGYVPILSLAMREYSWNTRAPGADTFGTRDRAKMLESAAGDQKTAAYTVVLPHLVRNYFGRELAPEITKALALNVSPFIVFGGRPDRNIIDESEGRMKTERERASAAAAAMDTAWDRLEGTKNVLKLDPDVLARVAYLRQVFHATALTAAIKEAIYKSQRLSSANQYDEAAKVVLEGKELLEKGRTQLAAMEAEGPPQVAAVACSARLTLDKMVPVLAELLGQREQLIATERRSGGLPKRVMDVLAEESSLPITATDKAPQMDGKLDDDIWRKSYPSEAWFQVGSDRLMAEAETRFFAVADAKDLYIGFRCQAPVGTEVGLADADREFVRVYIKRPGDARTAMLALAVWANGRFESTDRNLQVQSKVTVNKGQWEGEMKIPLTALGPAETIGQCRMGFVRSYSQAGMSKIAATVPLPASIGGPFEDGRAHLERLPQIKWEQPDFNASARVRILEPKVREVTLDDRIATIVDFRIMADSDCVLDDVSIEAEAVDAEGKVESRKKLLAEPSMRYSMRPNDVFRVTYLQAVDKGSVRVKLVANETEAEASHQFGE